MSVEPTSPTATSAAAITEHGILGLSETEHHEALRCAAASGYALSIPELWRRQTLSREMLRQVLPTADELATHPHFTTNPLKEQAPTPGEFPPYLLQKYAGRALLVTTNACFGNCRFCFRRHLRMEKPDSMTGSMVGFKDSTVGSKPDCTPETSEFPMSFVETLRPDVTELILSGGDPLVLCDAQLAQLIARLETQPQLRRLRIHTRAVSFCPERITEDLLEILKRTTLTVWFVLHINHPDELELPGVPQAIQRLRLAGFPLLQQGVLLRGVNDDFETLKTLYLRLADLQIVPYYLHQLDQVQGAAHFEVPIATGRQLIQQLRDVLPGYALPRYVREIPGQPAKTVLE